MQVHIRILFLFCLTLSLCGCASFSNSEIKQTPVTYACILTELKNSIAFDAKAQHDIVLIYVFRKPFSRNVFCLVEYANDYTRHLYELTFTKHLECCFINRDFEELLKYNNDNNYYHRVGLDENEFYVYHICKTCDKKSKNSEIGTNFHDFIKAINKANEFLLYRYGLTIECYPMIKCIFYKNDMRIDVVCITNVQEWQEDSLCYFYDSINGDTTVFSGSVEQGLVFNWFVEE